VRVSFAILIPLVGFGVAVVLAFGALILKAHRAKVLSGAEEMVDMAAVAETDLNPSGKIFFHGEYWNAEVEGGAEVKKGQKVVVTKVENLTCKVRKA
jgi:membrane-bound serine protease (ClpP class)